MPLIGVIIIVVVAIVLLVVISYIFRDAFFLFEGICVVFDFLGSAFSSLGDGIDFDGGDGGD